MKVINFIFYATAICLPMVFCAPAGEDPIGLSDVTLEIQKFLSGDEFRSVLQMEEKKHLKKIGQCIGRLGQDAGYDIENKNCFNCTVEKCSGSVVCTAQCRDTIRISELEIESRSLRAQNKDLYLRSALTLILLGVLVILMSVIIVWKIHDRWASRYDTSKHPDGDKSPTSTSSENPPNYRAEQRNSREEGEGRAFLPEEQPAVEEHTV